MVKEMILDSIKSIDVELKKIEDAFNSATKKQSMLDNLRNDIEHEIELDKLSAVEMTKKYKELQACLRLRRKYKDELEYLLAIRDSVNLTLTKNAKERVEKVDKKLSNRTYNIRIKQEVRDELLKELEMI